jgi:hypothetical protein
MRYNHSHRKVRPSRHSLMSMGRSRNFVRARQCRKDWKTTHMNSYARLTIKLSATTIALALTFMGASIAAQAQSAETPNPPQLLAAASAPESSSAVALPDAPSAPAFAADANQAATGGNAAPKYAKTIEADQTAQPITAHDKAILGLRDLYSPMNFAAMIASAGYEQALNGSPNYGTDRGAFGERLGAAGIRESTQGFFTDVVFSPMLHMDPRYYVAGPRYGFVHRVFYAGTRVLISKNDSGHNTINSPLLLGYAASTALSTAYYPQINRNFRDSASSYGGSLGGAAVGFLVSEFSDSLLKAVHMKK